MLTRLAASREARVAAAETTPEPRRAAEPAGDAPQSGFAFVSLRSLDGKPYELSIDAGDRDVFHQAVEVGGTHDDNWRFINRWITTGDVVFDVGANIGTISIPAAILGAKVHAFELLADNVRHLPRSAERNGLTSMVVVLGAVSDRNDPVGVGGTSAWGTVVETAPLFSATLILDDYFRARGLPRVDLMKIDVEGSELAALRGAESIIGNGSPDIVIEGNVVTSGNAGYSYREILAFPLARGYRIFRLHADRLCPWDNAVLQEVVFADYFASKRKDADITRRSGWAISPMTLEETVASILLQDAMPDLHKQYLVAVEQFLAPEIVADGRVSACPRDWRGLDDKQVREVLLTGAR